MTGLARCIAMVLIWNVLAGGDSEYCAVLVALNSVFQIVMYSLLAYFYLRVVPGWFGVQGTVVNISTWDIAKSVLIFLGIPLALGGATRFTMVRRRVKEWYETKLMPRLGPTALIGLLFTIVVMFSMQGDRRRDRHVYHRVAGSAGDCHRPADRGAGADRPGLRCAVDEESVLHWQACPAGVRCGPEGLN